MAPSRYREELKLKIVQSLALLSYLLRMIKTDSTIVPDCSCRKNNLHSLVVLRVLEGLQFRLDLVCALVRVESGNKGLFRIREAILLTMSLTFNASLKHEHNTNHYGANINFYIKYIMSIYMIWS